MHLPSIIAKVWESYILNFLRKANFWMKSAENSYATYFHFGILKIDFLHGEAIYLIQRYLENE
jgi:hypothetical protein